MKFVKLRLAGFKSFVEASEFVIEPGLTGVVGPNGCGKSNLVEAMRWVMGESSYKAMRASGMDDVIFSGSNNRPARNTAEVSLTLDNADRSAPAAFNDTETIEVIRRIEREQGSLYRINGREVRARDVQLLFADASTGARSPALVRQGQIGELIAAKPQARRAILEEAAGISGLYSRRHEAELRLKGAEQNLDRLEDVLVEIDQQLESLKRQARQATRYRSISADIRKAEATLFHLRWTAARGAVREADAELATARRAVAERATAQGEAAKNEAVAALRMPELREAEARAAAALQRLTLARGELEAEEKRARARLAELAHRIAQLDEDIAREHRLAGENEGFLEALAAETATLVADTEAAGAREREAADRLGEATVRLQASEAALTEATREAAEVAARRDSLARAIRDAGARLARLEAEAANVAREAEALAATLGPGSTITADRDRLKAAEAALATAEAATAAAETATEAARNGEAAARAPLAAAEAELNRHEAEAGTLERILAGASGRKFAPVVDRIKVAPGFEAALGAALGDDLEASLDAAAPARWTHLAGADAVEPLPDGADPLSARVEAPAELARRLARVGLVSRERGAALQARLSPGQRLVSREGDLWRWDGFTATAEAPTAATERLAQKNRLEAVLTEAALARATVGVLKETLAAAATSLADAVAAERARREAARAARTAEAEARAALARAERRQSEALARKEALDANGARLAAGIEEARAEVARAEAALAEAADPTDLQQRITVLRTEVANDRAGAAEARATADGLAREAGLRQQRLAAIERERSAWQARIANSQAHVATLAERRAAAAAEHEALAAAPDEFDEKRRALDASLGTAGATRRDAADRLAEAETGLAAADRAAREALAALSEAREGQARAEERLSAALERVREVEARIVETLEVEPGAVAALAGLGAEATLPPTAAVEDRLERLRQERERLGSVNLRAEDEVREIAERRDALVSERDDLVEAIRRLRQAIGSLNREGRERLLAAFEEVNGHFRDLFQKLFGGGTAELMLTESDDPLEAGLEIVARPPGKKPQTMTLLSGGEQALTAMSLIFAVFLTNPAPICVLDEVDAPLDDANVERFCNLVDEMTRLTDTRFLVVTHNPITMARMDRLYGVTMAERGVSQLVSVDLETAERFREAS